ncbi:AmmeMemoRadiSam system radical SAM enzyme [Candidatus Micrarchaeota archaeon CG11_big_fil_rev_8_21_14_0_20_47_5]|nr:MAG: AmmeMemoRadiSam system radical SAM enzyme [Candidatus Micrarchaeota archaeon CG1_02_47_40]PIN82907.1 MAG: AmmeMemoRadiSam system radical SAM enzyme [Candidatus Micrarchaeota archaeon CG11_big_fil_rev_8_21_14_0_20_47_5]
MKEALLYEKLPNNLVKCHLCRRNCTIAEGKTGFCHVRKNENGKLYSLNYAKCCSYNTDPIEKKPFYHFLPGTLSFSIATVGCNFSCLHCQNASISQAREISGIDLPPEKVAQMAKSQNAKSIAYTYTEPTIFMEYALDCAKLARKEKLANVFVTNGYMSREAIALMQTIDAARIDLKAFNDKFYKEVCGGASLDGVLDSIKLLHKKMHIELIVLLIPTLNDDEDELHQMCKWVRKLSPEIPIHFTAYYPCNKMAIPPTPLSTLQKARRIALEEGIHYAYTGNAPGDEGENTYCPKCKALAIKRFGFSVLENRLAKGNACPKCGYKLKIIMKAP